jgi:DNA-binding LytR/AlgR family response regulator
VVRLEQNYRSTQRILRVADRLIGHNRRRKEKGLFTENAEGRPQGQADPPLSPRVFRRQRLQHAVERARRLHRDPISVAESVATLQEIAPVARTEGPRLRSIVGKAGEEYFLLNPNEVLAFRANGELVWIITAQSRYLATQNLKTIEERLQSSSFRRVHRNALVNVNEIRKMSIITSQRWLITLNNGEELVVSKSQAKNVRDILHW